MESIHTERLRLDPLTSANTLQMRSMWVLPQVRKHLWDGIQVSEEKALEVSKISEEALANQKGGLFLAYFQETVAGFCGFWPFFEPPVRELVVGLHPSQFKSGLAEEMGQAMVKLALDTWGWEKIQASVDSSNPDFVTLLEKLRFASEETFTWMHNPYTRYVRRKG